MAELWMFLGAGLLLVLAVGGYVAWRDRGRRQRTGGARFDGDGEAKSAAYLADVDRGIEGSGF